VRKAGNESIVDSENDITPVLGGTKAARWRELSCAGVSLFCRRLREFVMMRMLMLIMEVSTSTILVTPLRSHLPPLSSSPPPGSHLVFNIVNVHGLTLLSWHKVDY
jgi:hypothetical protein